MLLDSNVILYGIIQDDRKTPIAARLMEQGGFLSVQTLNEVTNVLRKKKKDWEFINRLLEDLYISFSVLPMDIEVHKAGVKIAGRYGLSTYDSMIVACAYVNGIETVLSEDMQNGQVIFDTVRIVNPFG
ncbi:ribonuclease VapC [Acetobacter aceti]|uniref:Ribonuclease VapC n=2 Tax=Acetobacter aceti TaxID=435 RepID=A0A6S6PLA8_ACEAC|nr:PIN domain-containing protein [Acetobacter aceti]BCI66014.1 ribonuclease VapC [Acetobacter aceti]